MTGDADVHMSPAQPDPPRSEALARASAPMRVSTLRVADAGLIGWAVALVVVLAVPGLRTGSHSWYPWCCVAGLAIGALGWTYLRRGRGNAAGP